MFERFRSFVLGSLLAVVGCGPATPALDDEGTSSGHEGSVGTTGEVTSDSHATTDDQSLDTTADPTLASDATSPGDTGTSVA